MKIELLPMMQIKDLDFELEPRLAPSLVPFKQRSVPLNIRPKLNGTRFNKMLSGTGQKIFFGRDDI